MTPRQIASELLRSPLNYPREGESLWVWISGQRIAGYHVGDGSEVPGFRRVEWEGPWEATAGARESLVQAIERAAQGASGA